MKPFLAFARRLVAGILKHNIGALGAIIAFFGFSAMVPLLLLMTYGASLCIPHHSIQQFLSDLLKSYVPTIPGANLYLAQNVSRLVSLGPRVGIFGVMGLLWSTVGGFVSFQQTLDVIWETRHRRSFLKQYLVGFGMLGILLLLTVLSSLATIIIPLVTQGLFVRSGIVLWLAMVHNISRVAFPLLLFLTCYSFYRFLPSYRLRDLYLVIGALVSTGAIYISRELFVWYTGHLGQYQMIYGSLTFIMLFTFWIYIVSIIILLGAEVAMALQATQGIRDDDEVKPLPHSRFIRRRTRL
ncbi:YihY/virulence factor BrkB family protein [Alicyclobacillus herbarius]|uniref:YihY/virulence factor BrkB family protein n=1 Tax=Alicyclobacillus herbarius TaxID=122960 RepID=UPI0004030372|nr:YihY/virulence factor BrkB family protein [Alicyclobacillus herbarius]